MKSSRSSTHDHKAEEPRLKVVDRRSSALRRAAGEEDDSLADQAENPGAGGTGPGAAEAPGAGTGGRLPTYVAELQARTEEAERRMREMQEAYRSSLGEQEDVRKRLTADVERRVNMEIARASERFVEVLDDLDRALRHAENDLQGSPAEGSGETLKDTPSLPDSGAPQGFAALVEGVRLVRDRFLAVLRERGVERIETAGRPFDPHIAEAVQVVGVDDPALDGTVLEELQAGYELKGQLIRPARVLVGRFGGASGFPKPAGASEP